MKVIISFYIMIFFSTDSDPSSETILIKQCHFKHCVCFLTVTLCTINVIRSLITMCVALSHINLSHIMLWNECLANHSPLVKTGTKNVWDLITRSVIQEHIQQRQKIWNLLFCHSQVNIFVLILLSKFYRQIIKGIVLTCLSFLT